ncbi:MAG TPA: hypothetical protein VNU70_14345 [Puia sp.]|jgi:hypothetical protein|nr:hypothetical protein [Puia sp.]
MQEAGYNDSVFINCPFDDSYIPIFRAIIYAIYRCGFFPQTAMDEDDGSTNRLDKIIRKIKNCRYGIHDLSRIELNEDGYPRFNMPFELGIFFGAKYLGEKVQKGKNALVFERKKYTYQKYISDLNGVDTKAHQNKPAIAIEKVRDWLRTASSRKTIPGYKIIEVDYKEFNKKLPTLVRRFGFRMNNLPFTDFRTIVEEMVLQQIR